MKLCFDSVDEVRAFVKNDLKGARAGKNSGDDEANPNPPGSGSAPAPLQPPQGQAAGFPGAGGFAPPGAGAGPAGTGFPAAGVGPSPEVLALVQRIAARIDWSVTPAPQGGGQPVDQVLAWFRNNVGDPNAASYTLDQIKQVALPRASQPVLENIAKLIAA